MSCEKLPHCPNHLAPKRGDNDVPAVIRLARWLACVDPVSRLALAPARAETEVDLALVVAVDISYSMDTDEQALQREGFAEAFRSPQVHDAIRRGLLGRIAVTYMEWAGSWDQKVIVPWTILDNPESADGLRGQDGGPRRCAAPSAPRSRAPSISA